MTPADDVTGPVVRCVVGSNRWEIDVGNDEIRAGAANGKEWDDKLGAHGPAFWSLVMHLAAQLAACRENLNVACAARDQAQGNADSAFASLAEARQQIERLWAEKGEELLASRAREKALREALEDYGEHRPGCHSWRRLKGQDPAVKRPGCTCGLDALRAGTAGNEGGG